MRLDKKKTKYWFAVKSKTINDVAIDTGLWPATISRVINGGNAIPATLGKIAKALDVELREILADEDE